MKHIVIIGNGISGVTAARHIRKNSDYQITIISSETRHFFSRTALMYVYMGHLKFEHTKPYEDFFWKKNRIDLVFDHVVKVNAERQQVDLKSGNTLHYDALVIASGSRSNKFGWPGQDLVGVQGLYSYNDLVLMEGNTKAIKHAVLVGGGLIGIEMAEMLLTRGIRVTFLVREPEFWSSVLPMEEARLITNHIRSHHVDLKLTTELREIISDHEGKVKAVKTEKNEIIECQFVGLAVGVSPNIEFLSDSGIRTNNGVLVDSYLQTNIPNVYAIGDCVERTYQLPGRKNIEQVWYTGRMMGEVVAQTICGTPSKYEPGPWFNSAKFLDIEYQTYGTVSNVLSPAEDDFYWEHHGQKKAIHFVWNKDSKKFLGVNTFGIRLRHEYFDRWLRQKKDIQFVIAHLQEANFDPEFFERHENEIANAFYQKYPSFKAA
ncbi:FAD-dependent oxidoreductase [Chryseolinea sp. H1M3-3]|uniref:NAD(P)/FAD-dependent oxidoreductase n=1 Tax=Chryseolinea sp. H1M3-3 TaxID=3034144 RepID=UPI0023EBEFBF|nr:FAD-dependent oxidoreductase [Chryseolinea sp. H1M3-3]